MLSQLLVLFGFFALVLVSVYWINQAVRLFDRLIADGQSAYVVAEFTALSLPNVIRLVLPMSAFAGAVYVTNRLSSESELVVMQSTGFSPWRLARPVLYYGLIVAVMMSLLTHFLVPKAMAHLRLREIEVQQNITAKLLTEGTFLHPSPGITFYIREISPDGALEDVFLSDRRSDERILTFTAARAYLINDTGTTRLIMLDGLAQTLSLDDERLFTTRFSDFSYDISGLMNKNREFVRNFRHLSTWELLRHTEAVATETEEPVGRVLEEAHGRFNQALLCTVAAMIGFSTLLMGGFSRFGVWRQIVAALMLLVLVKLVEGLVSDPVRNDPSLWPLVYLPSLTGMVMSASMLWWAARPRRIRRAAAGVAEEVSA